MMDFQELIEDIDAGMEDNYNDIFEGIEFDDYLDYDEEMDDEDGEA